MNRLIIKHNKTIPRASIIICFCEIIVFAPSIWFGIKEGRYDDIWISLSLWIIAGIIHIHFLMKYWFWRLELGTYVCYYQNWLGKRKEFYIRDIKQVGLRQKYIGLTKNIYLELMDDCGKIIVRINMLTVENLQHLIPFLEEHNTEVVFDDMGKIAIVSKIPELQDHIDKRSSRQIHNWKKKNEKWEKAPAFYQNPIWLNRIRKIGWGLDILMFIGMALAQICSKTVAALVYGVVPILLMSYFLIFHRVLVWKTPKQSTREWEEAHVVMPNMLFSMFLFFFWCPLLDMNFTTEDKFSFGGKICALLLILLFIYAIWQKAWGRVPGMILSILIYSYIGTYCWNYLFTPKQEPVYGEFEVLEKEEGGFWTCGSRYHLLVGSEEEGEIHFHVSFDSYKNTELKNQVIFGIKKSVFGVEYCEIMENLSTQYQYE